MTSLPFLSTCVSAGRDAAGFVSDAVRGCVGRLATTTYGDNAANVAVEVEDGLDVGVVDDAAVAVRGGEDDLLRPVKGPKRLVVVVLLHARRGRFRRPICLE